MSGRFDEFGNRLREDSEVRVEEVRENGATAVAAAAPADDVDVQSNGNDSDSDNYGFGSDVEVVIEDEAMDEVDKPLVAPAADSSLAGPRLMIEGRASSQPVDYLMLLASTNGRQRSFAVAGDLHHGKTSFLRALLGDFAEREDEKLRQISLKANPVTGVCAGKAKAVSTLFTAIDTPGHADFQDEVAASMRLVDGVVLCVDVVEGVLSNTERIIRRACQENLKILLLFTKMDRFILDLKYPPIDAYRKLKTMIDHVNNIIMGTGQRSLLVSPPQGTVAFSSTKLSFCFTLNSFARHYASRHRGLQPEALAQRLWGPITFDAASRKFVKASAGASVNSFTAFVLDPIYKIVSHAITGKGADTLHPDLSAMPTSSISAAVEALETLLGEMRGEAADAIVAAIPPPPQRNESLQDTYQITSSDDKFAAVVSLQRASATDGKTDVVAVARVIRGSITTGSTVDVCNGDTSTLYTTATVRSIFLKNVDGVAELPKAVAGQVVYMTGISDTILRGAVVLPPSPSRPTSLPRIAPLHFDSPMIRIGIEPVNEEHQNTLRVGLDIIVRTYPGCELRVNETTWERTVCGFGEVYLDALMRDLRAVLCRRVPVKLSDPYVPFGETVTSQEGVLDFKGTEDLQLSMTANAIPRSVASQFEAGTLRVGDASLPAALQAEHGWDILDSMHVVAVGPSRSHGSCVLVDDSFGTTALAPESRDVVAMGFQRAMERGPLCGEAVQNVKLSVIESTGAGVKGARKVQLQRFAREASHGALLGAFPTLLEPVCAVDILTDPSCVEEIETILRARRGNVVSLERHPGTPFTLMKCQVPTIDTFGFETAIRVASQGRAFPVMQFDHWAPVPGDPFDSTVKLKLLQPASGHELAADFVAKTRRRYGMRDLWDEYTQ